MLSIKKLSKKFGSKTILNDISFSVRPGEIAAFLGASGVGKSTLLRILNNLETYDQGSIELDGKQLNLETVNSRHTVGMVFQHFNLFINMSVQRNITLPLEKTAGYSHEDAVKVADALLAKYGLIKLKDAYVSQLSGGQKQRLAIVRSIALKPRIICFDEPTSALDPMLTTQIAQLISDLAKEGFIVLVATHDTTLLEKLDCTMYLMKDGAIVESARTKDFQKNPTAYFKLKTFILGISEDDGLTVTK